MAFYSENSQLEQRLADSDAVGKIMLLNTELVHHTPTPYKTPSRPWYTKRTPVGFAARASQ